MIGNPSTHAVRPNGSEEPADQVPAGGPSSEAAIEEGQDAKAACQPCKPTQEEVDLHNVTHVPFRNWCPFCVMGKAKANPHFKRDDTAVDVANVVSIDYAFLGTGDNQPELSLGDNEEEEAESSASEDEEAGDKPLTVLVLRDRKRRYVTASVVPRKGDHPYTVQRVGYDISHILGYKRCVLKSDQEPAIKKLNISKHRS